jgi:hypothetical protein
VAIDPSTFRPINVADTCAVWNCLSSTQLFAAALAAKCSFCCTSYVLYECLHKPRSVELSPDVALMERLRRAIDASQVTGVSLTIEDLQDVAALETRKSLGKGELASIAFARRARLAFLTDDQKARRLAASWLGTTQVQTTPHLLAWLYFNCKLGDGDLEGIIREHKEHDRPLEPHLRTAYHEALRCRLAATQAAADHVGGTVRADGHHASESSQDES